MPERSKGSECPEYMVRHSLADRLFHWFNALCWLALFVSGMALLSDPLPLGQGFAATVRRLAGGPEGLLLLHLGLGLVWCLGGLVYVGVERAGVLTFLERLCRFRREDVIWLARKPFLMLLGKARTQRLGITPQLPPQDFYNMGQKLFGLASLAGCALLVGSGAVLGLAVARLLPSEAATLIQWSLAAHFAAAVVVFLGLMIHVYMAAISPAERPGLVSMFTGSVSAAYARSHHALWAAAQKN